MRNLSLLSGLCWFLQTFFKKLHPSSRPNPTSGPAKNLSPWLNSHIWPLLHPLGLLKFLYLNTLLFCIFLFSGILETDIAANSNMFKCCYAFFHFTRFLLYYSSKFIIKFFFLFQLDFHPGGRIPGSCQPAFHNLPDLVFILGESPTALNIFKSKEFFPTFSGMYSFSLRHKSECLFK